MDSIPIGIILAVALALMSFALELGYKAGNTHSAEDKKFKEKITTQNSAAIIGLLGFLIVFTFHIVYNRYDDKKHLVREEANSIRTSWLRSDFLPVSSKKETADMLKRYVDIRIILTSQKLEPNEVQNLLNESTLIQYKIWGIVSKLKDELDTHTGAMYIESLNEMFNLQAMRIAVGMQLRIPTLIIVMLFIFVVLSMFSLGYQVSVSGSSRRSWLTPVMVITFSLLITLIIALDRPNSSILPVTQQPLIDVRAYMDGSIK